MLTNNKREEKVDLITKKKKGAAGNDLIVTGRFNLAIRFIRFNNCIYTQGRNYPAERRNSGSFYCCWCYLDGPLINSFISQHLIRFVHVGKLDLIIRSLRVRRHQISTAFPEITRINLVSHTQKKETNNFFSQTDHLRHLCVSQSGKINKLTGRISFYDFEFYLLVRDDGVITFVVTQQPTNNNWHRNGRRGRNDIKTIGRAKAFSFSMPLMPSTFDFFF